MKRKHMLVRGDFVLLEDVRHVGAMHYDPLFGETQWSTEIFYTDGKSFVWDAESQEEAEALRDEIIARMNLA